MQGLWDFLDNYIYGPLNYVDRIEGLIKAAKYQDAGHQFAIPRPDKGGKYALRKIEKLLQEYGVAVFCRTFDADNHYFRVKQRQAEWAEYLMLLKGVELQSPLINPQNAIYAARAPAGWMPRPWSKSNKSVNDAPQEENAKEANTHMIDNRNNHNQTTGNSLANILRNFFEWD